MESVEPENASGPETVALRSEPVPLPTRSPESVVEPVPPKPTESVEVADTMPLVACSTPLKPPTVSELTLVVAKVLEPKLANPPRENMPERPTLSPPPA